MPQERLKAYRFHEPINAIGNINLGKPVTIEYPLGKTICYLPFMLEVTASATGAATKTIPRPSWGASQYRFKLGNVNRTRNVADMFGIRGLKSRNDKFSGGRVQYLQGGNVVTVAYQGFTIGNEPVLIDSPEDVALQAALANNTATVARFWLSVAFAEDWRKDPKWAGEGMALMTGFDDGTVLATPYLELDIPAATGVAGTMTGVAITPSWVYTDMVAAKGSQINMSKEKIHIKNYAAGDVELGDQFDTKDILQRFSIVTAGDKVTKVVVKRGNRIIRQVTFGENQLADGEAGVNADAVKANRFDVELDQNDDPTTAIALNRLEKLSIVATFATANDNPAKAEILASYYGPVE